MQIYNTSRHFFASTLVYGKRNRKKIHFSSIIQCNFTPFFLVAQYSTGIIGFFDGILYTDNCMYSCMFIWSRFECNHFPHSTITPYHGLIADNYSSKRICILALQFNAIANSSATLHCMIFRIKGSGLKHNINAKTSKHFLRLRNKLTFLYERSI